MRRTALHARTAAALARSFGAKGEARLKLPRKLQHKHAWDIGGTWFQGGRQEVQFFVGDLVECLRGGRWHCARVSRAPTDERPHDGSFRVKFDEDGKEMKCWYKDLRKVSRPVPAPPWLNSWQPEEAPPDEEGSWRHLEGPRHDAAASWRQGPPREALEISAAERRKEALLWEQHHVRSAKKKAEQEAITREYARLCAERDRQEGELHFGREELEVSDDSEEETST